MKTWKEYPWLFANGRFKVIENITGDNVVSEFTGVIKVTDGVMTGLGWSAWLKDCTLIARRIMDMTDEEIHEIKDTPYHSDVCETIKLTWEKEARISSMSGRIERELAKRGVYFGDQSHFGKDVIDIKTLEETE